jgi:hypothetical protein
MAWLVVLYCLIFSPVTAHAHSPFQSSARMILHDTTIEIILTVGMDGGKTLLQGAPKEALMVRTVGPDYPLPVEFGEHWFKLGAGGKPLQPDSVTARTDGLEFDLVLKYPCPEAGALTVDAIYVTKLPDAFKSAFAMTDDPGNILATQALSRDNHSLELTLPPTTPQVVADLPASLATITTQSLAAVEAVASTNPGSAVAKTDPVAPANPVLGFCDLLKLGVEHFLTGYDHLLFLCGLLVVCRKIGPMLAIITCFTVAHAVTLALAALGWVQVSARITEPLIAATIVFVCVENFRGAVSTKTRCGLALAFGLIHGFGFATALRESGLAGTGRALVKPLLAFNLGVEAGQLAVAAVFLPQLFALRRVQVFERYGTAVVSGAVVLLGGFWLVQRIISP